RPTADTAPSPWAFAKRTSRWYRTRSERHGFPSRSRCASAGTGCATAAAGSRAPTATLCEASRAAGFIDGIGRRVVARARAHRRPARPVGHYADLAERPVERLVGWRVGDGVLIANVVRHMVRDAVYVRQFLGIIILPT